MAEYKCIHCGFESGKPGKCPKCGVPLSRQPSHKGHFGCEPDLQV